MFIPKYTKQGDRGRRTRGPQTFCQTERGPLIPSDVLLSHNYMATGWDLSCRNIIRNVPLRLCDPSYTLLFSPLSALSSFLAPSFSSAVFLLAYSPWQQTFPGGFSGHWGSGEGFLGLLPSSSLSSAQLQPQHWSTEWESAWERWQDVSKHTQRQWVSPAVWIAIACNCSISWRVIPRTDIRIHRKL